uniref:Uncharacterized protein n=1 Tax=Meloidogyne javanica TaxID=6303 RepID=A0A915NE07_MELJA
MLNKSTGTFAAPLNKGIGKCPSIACKTCYKHLCNDGNDLPFSYCFNGDGKGVVGCGKVNCYIAKVEY